MSQITQKQIKNLPKHCLRRVDRHTAVFYSNDNLPVGTIVPLVDQMDDLDMHWKDYRVVSCKPTAEHWAGYKVFVTTLTCLEMALVYGNSRVIFE